VHDPSRYLRLYAAFARFGLATEMAFRANFLVKVLVEMLWIGILLVFYLMIFGKTELVAGWDRHEYLFFVGCHFTLAGLVETFFLGNCIEFPELIRSGDLDHCLLKPIDEQFLISCRNLDWSTLPNVLVGATVMGYALAGLHWSFDPLRLVSFLVVFTCGAAMTYSFLLFLTSTSVWFVRNQSLMELWWLFTTLMRYPREIYKGKWATPFGWFFTFIVPVLLVTNVPANTMVRVFEPAWIIAMVLAAAGLLFLSRRFFRYALTRYRSASS
jgi:ABC-2 type transport system permease protein